MIKKIWNEWNKNKSPKYPNEEVIRFTFRNFNSEQRKKSAALDFGCGSGVHTKFLAKEGFKVSAIDTSEEGIKNTLSQMSTENFSYNTIQLASVTEKIFENNIFEYIISIGVFECIDPSEQKKALENLHRMLKKGGKALLMFAAKGDSRFETTNNLNLYAYSHNKVKNLFKTLNWQEVNIDKNITTFNNQSSMYFDWLITVIK